MSVTTQWQSLMNVLRDLAPVTAASFRPGASHVEIDSAESALEVTFPAELRQWFTMHNGQDEPGSACVGTLLTNNTFFSLDEVIIEHAQLMSLSRDLEEAWESIDDMVVQAPAAGSPTALYIPAFIPISGFQNVDNFCDTRPGSLNGCVGHWDYATGGPSHTQWDSISQMLDEITRDIVNGGREGWKTSIQDGILDWEPATSYTPSSSVIIHPGSRRKAAPTPTDGETADRAPSYSATQRFSVTAGKPAYSYAAYWVTPVGRVI